MLKVLIFTIILVAIAFAGFAIKMFLKKDGKFTKSCSSVDPTTGNKTTCTCNEKPEQKCDNSFSE